jgi:HEPN domain-containing protein
MKSALDLARALRIKAESDLRTAELCVEHSGPLDAAAFHIQQAAEKLLKSLLASRGTEFPRTHDLEDLIDLALPDFPDLEPFRERLLGLNPYAVEMRYDAALYPDHEEVVVALETVKDLRLAVHRLLPEEAGP